MKTDTVYKQAFNETLDRLAKMGRGALLPSENELAADLSVSRTTVRKVLARLTAEGYIGGSGKARTVERKAKLSAYFPKTDTVPTSEQVEGRFMEWMLRGDAKPGSAINELELARQFSVGTSGVREFLNRFRRFGLIEKRPNSGWRFSGFTEDFALELFEIREIFEIRSARAFVDLPSSAPAWSELKLIEKQHRQLLRDIESRFHDFSELDNRFHRLIIAGSPNRFIDDFYDIITLIFHYHYQWNKRDERQRNEVAIREHLEYITALRSRDRRAVDVACRHHLASARTTLMRAFSAT